MQTWTRENIDVQPWQSIPDKMAALSLTTEDGLAQAWFVAENGRLTGGAEAVNDAMKYIWWARPFASLYHIPGIKQLEDKVYRWVADNRYRLPGSTPQCSIDGGRSSVNSNRSEYRYPTTDDR